MPKKKMPLFSPTTLYVEPRDVPFDMIKPLIRFFIGSRTSASLLKMVNAQRDLLSHVIGKTLDKSAYDVPGMANSNDQANYYNMPTFEVLSALSELIRPYRYYTQAIKAVGIMWALRREFENARDAKKVLILLDDMGNVAPVYQAKLKAFSPIIFDGHKSLDSINRFVKSVDSKVMIASISDIRWAKTPPDFTAINRVIVVDPEWSAPAKSCDVFKFIHNPRQKRRVYAQFVSLTEKVDATITELYRYSIANELNAYHAAQMALDPSYGTTLRYRSPNGIRVPRKIDL